MKKDREYRQKRIDALKRGRTQWGHHGRHEGDGTPDCPRGWHHHEDEFCEYPTLEECLEAGVVYLQVSEWGRRD